MKISLVFFGIKFWNKFPSIPIAVCIVVFAKKKSLNDLLVTKSQAADLYLHVSCRAACRSAASRSVDSILIIND